ncbi:DUF6089 family protein [Bacteroidetes bacterium endosymbiont of Geopemphigus sp.]|uniref:type IX secretion system protein PorG n=1 Tax=Bacteroidetes bacterium endosymbiont of Geopemphigus sp. TaxID=2047937 RepID=UPI0011AFAF58|nr:DUF6089 family protein [Bacteroidetes bacterium endosymbiont of Geopemphigus sp.]
MLSILFTMTLFNKMHGQRHEAGVFIRGSNLIWNVGRNHYVLPNYLSGGLIYRYILAERYALRSNFLGAKLLAKDQQADETYCKGHGKKTDNYIGEASVVFEFNFFDFNGQHKNKHTPFMFVGLGLLGHQRKRYSLYYKKNSPDTTFEPEFRVNNHIKMNYNIPFGIGYKYKFSCKWIAGFELGIRFTGTNQLDNNIVSKENVLEFTSEELSEADRENIRRQTESFREAHTFGVLRSNDRYVFSGLSLSYTFGHPSCYCD